jgi:hypothetical protein
MMLIIWKAATVHVAAFFHAPAAKFRRLTVAANLVTQNQAMLFVERGAASSGGAAWQCFP